MRSGTLHIPHGRQGEPLRCRNDLLADGYTIPWLWEEADEGTDTDRVCMFSDTEQGRLHVEWLRHDRPGYHIVRIDLPDDHDLIITRATWEDCPAVFGEIPAECLTATGEIHA